MLWLNKYHAKVCLAIVQSMNGFLRITAIVAHDSEKDIAELKEKYNRVDVIGYDALKNLTEAKEIIRALLFHLTNDTFYVTFETQEQSVEKARQFLRGQI